MALAAVANILLKGEWSGVELVSHETGFELKSQEGLARVWEVLERERLDVLVMAFPCIPWSIMQRMCMKTRRA